MLKPSRSSKLYQCKIFVYLFIRFQFNNKQKQGDFDSHQATCQVIIPKEILVQLFSNVQHIPLLSKHILEPISNICNKTEEYTFHFKNQSCAISEHRKKILRYIFTMLLLGLQPHVHFEYSLSSPWVSRGLRIEYVLSCYCNRGNKCYPLKRPF